MASLVLLIAGVSSGTLAKRLKIAPGGTLPKRLLSTFPRVNPSKLRTQLAAMTYRNEPEGLWSPSETWLKTYYNEPEGLWTPSETWLSPDYPADVLPPIMIHSHDLGRGRGVLRRWANLLKDSEGSSSRSIVKGSEIDDKAEAEVIRNMQNVIDFDSSIDKSIDSIRQSLARKKGIEMVGVVPKASLQLVLPGLSPVGGASHPSTAKRVLDAFDVSVRALGIFSRKKLRDDAIGSLRKQIVERYGTAFVDESSQQLNVFALEGLVDSHISMYDPGSSGSSARALLSKIAEYANQEKKVVVVHGKAYKSLDGADLTEYYESLGFQKVEMQGGVQVLLYIDMSEAQEEVGDVPEENQATMVGLNLWNL